MYKQFRLKPPFFELGPKAYNYGEDSVALALKAEEISKKYDVEIVYTPQYADIPAAAQKTSRLHIFAQHMDYIPVGRGIGTVLPESLKAAGACGVLLNHVEKPLSLSALEKTIQRADEVGLGTMVCADNLTQAAAIAHLAPNILVAESPELIGGGTRTGNIKDEIERINDIVLSINPEIQVLHAAGIVTSQDVYNVIAAGAVGSGSSSGVLKADDPFAMLEAYVAAARKAWDELHQ